MKPFKQAFTLIELLVVIAIIAILAAILFPVFGRARENARRTTCQSNLKQMGLAMIQYAQDYDETFPRAKDYGTGSPAKTWDALIEPYAQKAGNGTYGQGSNAYLVCPSDSVERTVLAGASNAKRSYAALTTEGLNANDGFGTHNDYPWKNGVLDGTVTYFPGRNLAEFAQTAGTILLAEYPHQGNRIAQNTNSTVSFPSTGGTSGSAQSGSVSVLTKEGIHFDGWNYLFVDGHVKWLKPLSAAQTAGKTYGGYGAFRNGNDFYCRGSLTQPCGAWTVAGDD